MVNPFIVLGTVTLQDVVERDLRSNADNGGDLEDDYASITASTAEGSVE